MSTHPLVEHCFKAGPHEVDKWKAKAEALDEAINAKHQSSLPWAPVYVHIFTIIRVYIYIIIYIYEEVNYNMQYVIDRHTHTPRIIEWFDYY